MNVDARRLTKTAAIVAVCRAVEAGRVVHAAHPDFGGVVTAGRDHRGVEGAGWALLSHGGSFDVSDEDLESAISLARSFVEQVGKWFAFTGASRAEEG